MHQFSSRALLRKAAESSTAALWDRIGRLLADFTPQVRLAPEAAHKRPFG
jgi:hypothetical protein